MTLVVGYAPDGRGAAVLHLAAILARSAQDDLVVCAVVPSPWPPGPAQIDSDYRRFLDGMARAALERARERLPGDVAAASLVHHARSAPAGLLEVAECREAAMIVVGTSGHPAIGSVTARLLHGSPVPVALAPHGFRSRPGARVARVTAAFGGYKGLVDAAAAVAATLGAPLRIASFAVPVHAPFAADLVERWVHEREAAGGPDAGGGGPRGELGGGHRRRRMARRRRARGRLQHRRSACAGVPRLPRVPDHPPLTCAGPRRPTLGR